MQKGDTQIKMIIELNDHLRDIANKQIFHRFNISW